MTPSRPLSLAHLTVLDTTPPELVTVAAAAGFRTIGIRLTATPSVGVPPYDALHDGPLLRETLTRLADTGVSVLDTEFLRFEPDQPVGVPEGFLEVSARLGAKNVLVMSAEPEEARTIERFGELCDRSAQYGLQVCLEFAIYTGVRTLAHAASILAKAKRSNASILIDDTLGPVTLTVIDNFVLEQNSTMRPLSNNPAGLRINMLSDNVADPEVVVQLDTVTVASNSTIYGCVYAPEARIMLSSYFSLYGALMSRSLDLNSNCNFHYDEHLMQSMSDGTYTYEMVSWRSIPFHD